MGKGVFAGLAGLIVVAVTVVLLASTSAPRSKCSPAHARRGAELNTLVPPGNSSVSEYVENVPTPRGGCPSVAFQATRRAGLIPQRTERALAASGSDGAATAALARATSEAGAASSVAGLPGAGGTDTASGGSSNAPRAAGGGSSPVGAVAEAIGGSSGGGGLGALLPIILIVCLLGTGAAVFLRQRRRS